MTTKAGTHPETIPVEGERTRKRGTTDPLDAIPYPEVRGFMLIERAFDGLDDDSKRRLAGLVADKYGPKPPPSIAGDFTKGLLAARSGVDA